MAKQKRGYVPRQYAPMPLDFRILEELPEVGMIGGVHWKGMRIKDVAANLTKKGVPVDTVEVTARAKTMEFAGMTKIFPATGSGAARIWAKTSKGTKFQETEAALMKELGLEMNSNREEQQDGS